MIAIKRVVFLCALCVSFSLVYAKSPKNKAFFAENLTEPSPHCTTKFIKLILQSEFDFKSWDSEKKGIEWVKEHIAFEFDTWDSQKIRSRIFFLSKDSSEFSGTGTIGWVEFDLTKQNLKEAVLEKDLDFDKGLGAALKSCILHCDFTKTRANQYKDENVGFLMQNEIVGKGRAYFYSAPNKNCKIDDLFLIPKDRVNLLQNQGEFSFIAYKRKSGEILKLWIKSDRISQKT